jgi:hypothetical protein
VVRGAVLYVEREGDCALVRAGRQEFEAQGLDPSGTGQTPRALEPSRTFAARDRTTHGALSCATTTAARRIESARAGVLEQLRERSLGEVGAAAGVRRVELDAEVVDCHVATDPVLVLDDVAQLAVSRRPDPSRTSDISAPDCSAGPTTGAHGQERPV